MILDSSKVSMTDGSQEQAIELSPGRHVLTPVRGGMGAAKVTERKIDSHANVMGLVLGNGQKLVGSRDQKVSVWVKRQWNFRSLSDIRIGDTLKGEKAGMTVAVKVIGLVFYPDKPLRLVELQLDKDRGFVAEGIQCR